jgi:hypothetical protein
MTTAIARAASLAARQDKALDRPYRLSDGRVVTFRERIEAGEFAYRTEHHAADGKVRRGLIEHADAAEAAAGHGLAFASYNECPKLVSDFAETLPTVVVHGYDDTTVVPA